AMSGRDRSAWSSVMNWTKCLPPRAGPSQSPSRRRSPEGIHFAFDRIGRTPNTLDAHRLVGLAERQGVQDAVVEALFRAYFTEGRDISNRQTLLDVVAEAALSAARPRTKTD